MANLCIAHSGGVTSILNTTAAASIQKAQQSGHYQRIYCAEFGLNGLIQGRLFDVTTLNAQQITQLAQTPSSVFGSCRYRLPDNEPDHILYQKIKQTCHDYGINHLIYQGGNDSQDTTLKLTQQAMDNFAVIGLPKTIDNDLFGTDFCPGYPSAAQYLLTSMHEAALDTWAMSKNSTQVFILEVMGRHTGWLAMATGLMRTETHQAPHCILTPERPFCQETWLQYVRHCVEQYGHCVVVASEGIVDMSGKRLTHSTETDAFGHQQLGGVGATLADLVRRHAGFKAHWALPDYLQRCAGHLRSGIDIHCAQMLGEAAVSALLEGQHGMMLGLERSSATPAHWQTIAIDLTTCANQERTLPTSFIHPENYMLSGDAADYLTPLLCQPQTPTFASCLPDYFDRNILALAQPLHQSMRTT